MTTDDFTTAARAEAESWIGMDLDDHDNFVSGAEWARAYIAAQEPTDAEIEAAAQELWKHRTFGTLHPNYPWDGLAPELRQSLRELARAALSAARAARRDEEKRDD